MIRHNNHNGFSLIEVMMSLAIIGILLTSVYGLQQQSLQSSYTRAARLERTLLLKNALYSPSIVRENHDEPIKKKEIIKEPKTTITITQKQALQEKLKKLPLEQIRARATWEQWIGTAEQTIVILRLNIPKKEQNT